MTTSEALAQRVLKRPPIEPTTEFPAYLPPNIREWVLALEAGRNSYKDQLNIYTCDTCRGHVVTRDIATGVTPFMTLCRATPECKGLMRSSMYRVFDQSMRASLVWDRPAFLESTDPGYRDHVERGGLILREPTEAERETV